jgi:hypothetical protein
MASSGTWSAPMPTRRTPVRGHESCPCSCRRPLPLVSILHDDNQPNAFRNSSRAVRNLQTHPHAMNTRRAHHTGSTGDSDKIEALGVHPDCLYGCTNSAREGQLSMRSPQIPLKARGLATGTRNTYYIRTVYSYVILAGWPRAALLQGAAAAA